MRRGGQRWPLIQQTFCLVLVVSLSGCAGSLPPAYIDTARFVDNRPVQPEKQAFQVEVQPFEHQLQDRTKVGTKRVGVNEISGPLLATQDVVSVLHSSVVTQLGLKGITVGPSALRLAGTVHDFFVDVDVDPASGRGRFRSVVRLALAVLDTKSQRQIWQAMYTGTASASAPSAVDSAYERVLKVAFTNLLNQIRQDDSLLELRPLYRTALPQVVSPPPSPPPAPVSAPLDTTPPRVVFLSPTVHENAREINTIAQVMLISGLIVGTNEAEKFHVEGVQQVEKLPASAQAMRAVGVEGPGIEFKAFVFLTPGVNRVEFQTVDRQGNPIREILTIHRQVDTTPPKLELLEPQLTPAVVVRTSRPRQLISGLTADESGVAEVQLNGVTAQMTTASAQELQGVGLSGTGVKFTGYAELQPGNNQVEITVLDRSQNVKSQVFTVQRQEMGREKIEVKQLYTRSVGVVIGIDAYDSWPRLTYAVHDAKEVQKALKALGFDEVIALLDNEATRARILQLFETELPKKVGKNDRLVIFFTGHAHTDALGDGTQMGYLVPVDTDRQSVLSTAISMTQIRSAAKQLSAKHIFYAIDACYSGLLLQRSLSVQPALDQDALGVARQLVAQPATQLVTAGRQGEQVLPEEKQSLFTTYLIQGLQGEADTNNDRLITATELASYLAHQVSIASDNRQTPQYGQIDGDGEVVFIY